MHRGVSVVLIPIRHKASTFIVLGRCPALYGFSDFRLGHVLNCHTSKTKAQLTGFYYKERKFCVVNPMIISFSIFYYRIDCTVSM